MVQTSENTCGLGRELGEKGGVTYIGVPLVNDIKVHIVERIDLRHCLVWCCMERDQHQLLSSCGRWGGQEG